MGNEIEMQEMSLSLEVVKGNTYLVTEDLSKIITRWCTDEKNKPYPDPEGQFYKEIMESLCESLQEYCFPDKTVKVINLPRESFADILDRRKSHDANALNEFWVSLDDVYANVGTKGQDGFQISITRFVDKDDGELERGPRPESNFDTIDEQILACARSWRSAGGPSRPVVLIDDGTFTGKTITTVLEKLADEEIFVDSIRLGVANPSAITAIAKWKHRKTGRSIRFLGCLKLCPPVFDWVAERDFFPGVPFSGRVVGKIENNVVVPQRAAPSNKPFRKPYLLGTSMGRIEEWARIDRGKSEFTCAAIKLSIKLWAELERTWGQEIRVKELAAIPWPLYRSDANEMNEILDMRWIDVLENMLKQIPH